MFLSGLNSSYRVLNQSMLLGIIILSKYFSKKKYLHEASKQQKRSRLYDFMQLFVNMNVLYMSPAVHWTPVIYISFFINFSTLASTCSIYSEILNLVNINNYLQCTPLLFAYTLSFGFNVQGWRGRAGIHRMWQSWMQWKWYAFWCCSRDSAYEFKLILSLKGK